MKAVILAAGMGRRLRPLTFNLPKAFIEIGGKPLIYRSLDNLRHIGINTVIIVTGFMESFFKEKLGKNYNGVEIIYTSNKEYKTTGSMYSLSRTEGLLNEDILLLESDLLYELKALEELLNFNYPNVILGSSIRNSGDEVYLHTDRDNFLRNLGKNINGERASGELVGINKLSIHFLKNLYKTSVVDYKKEQKNFHYEETIFKLSKDIPVKCHILPDLLWTEIDIYDDLVKAKNCIYPLIRENED